MKLIPLMFLMGCTYPKARVGIIHDYMFNNATKLCSSHQGLHYVVTAAHQGLHYVVTAALLHAKSSDSSTNNYHCEDQYFVRCQDGILFQENTGVKYCFISESQIEETLKPQTK